MPRRIRRKPPRPIRIEGDVAYVPLTQGYVAIIDADQVPRVGRWCWSVCKSSKARTQYAQTNMYGHGRSLHRYVTRCRRGLVVDHINGDGLDNRKANLRVCTQAENAHNKYWHRDPSLAPLPVSGFVGIVRGHRGIYRAVVVNRKKAMVIATGMDPELLYRQREWFLAVLGERPRGNARRVELAREVVTRDGIAPRAAKYLLGEVLGVGRAEIELAA